MSARYTGGLVYNAPGGWSGKFDGSGDNLSVASNANLAIGTGQYTAELWIYFNSISTLGEFFECTTTGNTGCFTFYFNGSNALQVVATGGAGATTITWTPVAGQWYHIAATRDSSNNQRVFINGVLFGTATSTNNYGQNGFRLFTTTLNGYVSNARLVVGSCLYTTNFTPPTGALTAVSGTQLLLCNQPTFVDKSANNFTVTVTSDAVVSTVNPFPTSQLPNPALGGAGNGVYTMSQYAALKAANLWPAYDPFYRNVTLNLHGNGTNAAQNNTFLDSSTNNFTITRNGNTTQGTFTPYGANWSNYFNGSSYFQIASTSAMNMNTYACLECWVNLSSSGANQLHVGRDSNYWIAYSFSGISGSANKFVFSIYNGSAWSAVSSSTSPTVGTWYHVAGIRSGSTLQIYINGVLETTGTLSGTATTSATPIGIADNQGTSPMTGYLSNVRVNLGSTSAVLPYTANFTPSTVPLTAVTGTQLLTCQSSRFVDNSTNALSLPIGGSPSVQRFSPFSPTTAYSTSVIGGSGYFDGSGDYLSMSQTAVNSSTTLTIEGWFYINSTATTQGLWGGGVDLYGINLQYQETSNQKLNLFIGSGSAWGSGYTSNTSLVPYTWYHIAYVRSGTTHWLYINGVVDSSINGVTASVTWSGSSFYVGVPMITTRYFNGYVSNLRVSNSVVYSGTFTPPTAPLTAITNTSLLLSYTNAAILDNAMMNDLETVGNAQISTSVKKYGTGSIAFDGNGDYLYINPSNNLPFLYGSGDFTVEAFIYPTGVSGYQYICSVWGIVGQSDATYSSWQLRTNSANLEVVLQSGGTTTAITGSGTSLTANTWQHVAVSRGSNTVKLFINGTQVASQAYSSTLNSPASAFVVGVQLSNNNTFTGYIDDLRITKGVARYTGNFTPPTSQVQDQ
jgi:hypothetical protein